MKGVGLWAERSLRSPWPWAEEGGPSGAPRPGLRAETGFAGCRTGWPQEGGGPVLWDRRLEWPFLRRPARLLPQLRNEVSFALALLHRLSAPLL